MKKNLIIVTGLCALIFSACKTSELSSFEDDIYKNPTEELQIARAKQAAERKRIDEENERQRQEAIAKKEAEDNNPYYQDPKETADDYYDYKYASRINRFSNPVNGAGYYDSRYTNYYTYNQNPMMFGSSIYSSYNWMPSNQFNNYSMGISLGYNSFGGTYGYSPFGSSYYGSFGRPYYDPFNPYGFGNGFGYGYGYSPYGFSSFNSFGYDPYYSGYAMGYHQGFYNGYNNGGWGYFNSFDANSGYSQMLNAPRGNSGGGNTAGRNDQPRVQAGGDGQREQFMRSMAEQQRNTPRFSESNSARSNRRPSVNSSDNGMMSGNSNARDNNQGQAVNPNINPNAGNSGRGQARERRAESQPSNNSWQQSSDNNNRSSGSSGGGRSSSGSNSSGGGSSPRGGGGNSGGGSRPR